MWILIGLFGYLVWWAFIGSRKEQRKNSSGDFLDLSGIDSGCDSGSGHSGSHSGSGDSGGCSDTGGGGDCGGGDGGGGE